ncbi:MAG: hypothetical protein KJ000_04525 [Pirellulaceae bacterium]|nr:hypothetical protein [Pirellulaceae bacterium]
MRDAGLVWFIVVISGGIPCFGQETFPYQVTLGQGRIDVRSGPGTSFYVTGHLSEGDSIEVYRHHEDGWLGIRPPAGSFSWVPADRLSAADQASIARVIREDTICRVGSQVAEVDQHVGQIYLDKDERVQLLDQPAVETRTAGQLEREGWRRISPPAGEFRWVRASDVKASTKPRIDRPAQISASEPADPNPSAPTVRQAAHWQQPPVEPGGLTTAQVIQAVAVQTPDEPVQESSETEPTESDSRGEEGDSPAAETESNWAARGTDSKSSAFVEKPLEGNEPGDSAAGWSAQRGASLDDLLDVEMRLAMTAAREIHHWRLQPLRDRIESLQPQLKTDAQREHAKVLLDRIAEYETLQNRFAVAGESGPLPGIAVSGQRTGAVGPPGWEDSLLSRFDGSGWLVPVHSARRVAPPYALLDAEGEVLFYVAPSPGLNLHRSLRKRVGIYGQRTVHESLNKPLIAAERVVDLGRHLH